MPAVDTGGAKGKRGKRLHPEHPKVIYAPQIKARPKPKPSRAVVAIPGVGNVARPTPAMHAAARTVARAKPKTQPKPAPPRNADTGDRARGRAPKRAPIFTRKPVAGMLGAERGAIEALSQLHAQDPEKYKKNLQRAGLEDRAIAGPRGQTVEHFKGRTTSEIVHDWAKPAPKKKKIVVAGFRGQTKPTTQMGTPAGKILTTAVPNIPKNVDDLITGMPTSIAHIAAQQYGASKELATGHPKKAGKKQLAVGKMLAQPYIDVVKDPIKELSERPVSTALTVTPLGRVPGLAAGRVARVTGKVPGLAKQTLERTPRHLPGTAMKVRVQGNRSYGKRQREAREDAARGSQKATAKDVNQRVDEFNDYATQRMHQARDAAAREAKQHGMDPEATRAHIDEATARTEAAMQEQFVRELGAHQRPAVGKTEKQATEQDRAQAKALKTHAKAAADTAHADVQAALAEARAARGSGSEHLTMLEGEHATALRELGGHRTAHGKAQLEHARAHGDARAAVKVPKTLKLQKLYSDRKAAKRELQTAQAELNKHRGKGSVIGAAGSAADRATTALTAAGERVAKAKENLKGKRGPERAAASRELRAAQRAQDRARGRAGATAGARPAAVEATEAVTRAGKRVDDAKAALAQVENAVKAEEGRARGVAPRQADRLGAAIAGLDEAAGSVGATRARVRDLSEQIAVERARTAGVPHAQMERLQNALHHRDEMRAAYETRKAEHADAKARDIATGHARAAAPLSAAAQEGRVFEHKSDANKVRDRLNEAGHEINVGGRSPVRYGYTDHGPRPMKRGEVNLPLTFKTVPAGEGRWGVVPEIAKERLRVHGVVGSSQATGAMLMKDLRQGLTKAVLPFSLKWLGGQASEAAIRSAISGAGPADLIRFKRTIKRMNEIQPGSGDALMTRISGGQFGVSGAARQALAPDKMTFAERYKDRGILSQPAAGATWLGQTLPGRLGKAGFQKWNEAVLGKINGAIESTARNAMAGHAIKRDFMSDHVRGLTEAALDDAARGLTNTHNQVAAARAVDRMYGQYQKFSPEMRHALTYWTPFLPWYLNTVKFLGHTITDHPVKTSLMVAASSATEEWRKANGLSAYSDNRLENWMQGSYPIFGDRLSRIGQFTPFGAFSDIPAAAGSLALPWALGPVNNALGNDYLGNKLRDAGRGGEPFSKTQKAIRMGWSLAESELPLVGQAGRWTGLAPRYIDRKDPRKIAPWQQRLGRELPLWPLGDPIGSGGGGGGGGVPGGGFDAPPIDVPPIDVPSIDVPPVDVG